MTSRAGFLGGAASVYASIAIARFPADAAEFNYKLGHDQPADHAFQTRLSEAVANIASESSGQLDIKLFPGSQLGGDPQMLAQLRSGALEIFLSADIVTATVVPECNLDTVSFALPTFPVAWAAMDGDVGKYVRNAISKIGVYAFQTTWDSGFKDINNNVRPIAGPDDMKGLKLRVAAAPMSLMLYKSLNASPVPINYNELYTSLQTHVVDGADIALSGFIASKFGEVQKYFSMTNHNSAVFTLMVGGDAWTRLPKKIQDIVERNFDAAAKLERDDMARQVAAFQATVKSQGVAINDADPAAFRTALRKVGFYAHWRDEFGAKAWSLLEKYSGPLG